MVLPKKDLEKLATKYQAMADKADAAYQETGLNRYYATKTRNEDLADALRMAAAVVDDQEELVALRGMMANFASRAAAATGQFRPKEERAELAMKLAEELAAYGHLNGYIGKE
jgi:hypothetical protein